MYECFVYIYVLEPCACLVLRDIRRHWIVLCTNSISPQEHVLLTAVSLPHASFKVCSFQVGTVPSHGVKLLPTNLIFFLKFAFICKSIT